MIVDEVDVVAVAHGEGVGQCLVVFLLLWCSAARIYDIF